MRRDILTYLRQVSRGRWHTGLREWLNSALAYSTAYGAYFMDKNSNPAVQLLNPAGLYDPAPNGYSHVARLAPNVRLVYTAGQGGENAESQLSPDFAEQVRQAFANVQIALAAADAQIQDVAKITVLIVDHSMERLQILGAEISRVWGELPAPACTLIPVPRLALDEMLFEVEAVAAVAV